MKRSLLLALCFLALSPLGFGVDKEVLQIKENVALLQGMMRDLQRSFDEKMAVMQTLMGQSNEKINQASQSNSQLSSGLAELQRSVQGSNANAAQKVDNLNRQMQGLQLSLDELRMRLDRIPEQVLKLQSTSPAIPAGGGERSSPAGPSGFPAGSSTAFPPPGGALSQPAPEMQQMPQEASAQPEPTTIELGQTKDQVVAALGPPVKMLKLGNKDIYVYENLKVTFLDGKVSDVQ